MSGFVALYHPDGRPVNPSSLERMSDTLQHRGMDASGLWLDGHVGFGHRMRRTTPESLDEHLPLFEPTRRLAITADARLDNRDELLAVLETPDRKIPDSSLILLAYDRWGEACPEKLLGDFAFVIWDERSRTLFCARDHIGVKPLFYHWQPGRVFACASEIKALLSLPEVPRRVNESRVGDCFALLFQNKEATFYHDILRLPPGHHLTIRASGIRVESYWKCDLNQSLDGLSNEQYAEGFCSLFKEAVQARLRSAYAVGSTLSGGLDSSSVTCMARDLGIQEGHAPLHTYSLSFPDVPSCDERGYIQDVLDQGGITPRMICGDELSPLRDFEQSLSYEDEPYLIPNLFLFRALHESASADGVRVLLDGVDGDTAVSHGEAYLTDLARTGRLVPLCRELLGIARNGRIPWQSACRSYVVNPLIPNWLRQSYRNVRRRRPVQNFEGVMRSLVQDTFAERMQLEERIQTAEHSRKKPRSVRETHWHSLDHGWVTLALEATDRTAQRLGIEARHPFFDKRIIELSLALPPSQKLSQGWTRIILRRAMEGILPRSIQWRPGKTNFTPKFIQSLMVDDRDRLEEAISASSVALQEYLDMVKFRKVYERSITSGEKVDVTVVWYAVTVGLWLLRQGAVAKQL